MSVQKKVNVWEGGGGRRGSSIQREKTSTVIETVK